MLVLSDQALTSRISDPGIRALAEQRFAEILAGEPYDYDRHGSMLVVEAGDSVAALEQQAGFPILKNSFDEARYPDPDYIPTCETLEEHESCYEMVYILNDDGFAITIFIPKAEGIDGSLLAMCAQFATPAIDQP